MATPDPKKNRNGTPKDADTLATLLAQEIEAAIASRLGSIDNPALRKAITGSVREAVYEKLEQSLAGQIPALIDDSIEDITGQLGLSAKSGATRKKAPKKSLSSSFGGKSPSSSGSKSGAKTTPTRRVSSSGSKSSASGGKSGGKTSTYTPPKRSAGYGGKGGGYGGK